MAALTDLVVPRPKGRNSLFIAKNSRYDGRAKTCTEPVIRQRQAAQFILIHDEPLWTPT